MTLLTKYSLLAERKRGLKWADLFESNETIARNGGTITGSPIVDDGASLDGSSDYLTYDLSGSEFAGDVSIRIRFTPDFAATDNLSHYLFDTSGVGSARFRILKFSSNALSFYAGNNTLISSVASGTYAGYWNVNEENELLVVFPQVGTAIAYLNGNQLFSVGVSLPRVIINTLVIGATTAGTSLFDGTIHSFGVYNASLDIQEILDYYNRVTWRYLENTTVYLPMCAEQHDPTNVRTLDVSGKEHHATFGDGSTPATYPTKLIEQRGYDFLIGSSTYLEIADSDDLSFGDGTTDDAFSIALLLNTLDVTDEVLVSKGRPGTNPEYRFEIGGADLLSLRLYDASTGGYIGRGYNLDLDIFEGFCVFWAATYSGSGASSGIKLYFNGEQVDDFNVSGGSYTAMENRTEPVSIGRLGNSSPYLEGKLYEVFMFNRELTQTQILDLYLAMLGRVNDV